MARVRIVEIIAVAALAGSLAACGSSASTPTAAPATSTSTDQATTTSPATTTPPTTAATTDTTTSPATASSTTASGATKVGALLAAFGTGDITVKHMPTADPSWVARVQTENQQQKVPQAADPDFLNLMALVDEAAREKDTTALVRLCTQCDARQQTVLWAKPGVLEQLSSLIEKAPMGEGTVLPDFLLAKDATSFDDADDTAYGKLVGVSSPAAFFAEDGGVWTSFQNGTGGLGLVQAWMGIGTVGQ